MLKTTITPKKSTYKLSIPEQYVGKKVEIILYAVDEVSEIETQKPKKTLSAFKGILSEQEFGDLKLETERLRKEWNRDI